MGRNQQKENEKKDNLVHEDHQEHVDYSNDESRDLEDNDLQGSLTGEGEEEEDVSGDLAGNAAGNPEE